MQENYDQLLSPSPLCHMPTCHWVSAWMVFSKLGLSHLNFSLISQSAYTNNNLADCLFLYCSHGLLYLLASNLPLDPQFLHPFIDSAPYPMYSEPSNYQRIPTFTGMSTQNERSRSSLKQGSHVASFLRNIQPY